MGFSDFDFSLRMRDTVNKIAEEAVQRLRPKHRYGQVTSIDRDTRKCGVILNGDTEPVIVNMGSLQPYKIGQYVRINGTTDDKYIEDVIGPCWVGNVDLLREFVPTPAVFSHVAGQKYETATTVRWTGRFIKIPVGYRYDATLAPAGFNEDGYLEFYSPAAGTAIPYYSSGETASTSTVTVDASGNLALANWDCLYYEPDLGIHKSGGVAAPGTDSSRYRIVNYQSYFQVPRHWIAIVSRSGDSSPSMFKWIDGTLQTGWLPVTFSSGVSNYDAVNYEPVGYKRVGHWVHLKGLLKMPNTYTGGISPVFVLPAFARPAQYRHFITIGSDSTYGVRIAGNSGADSGTTGTVSVGNPNGTSTAGPWISLDNIRYEVT